VGDKPCPECGGSGSVFLYTAYVTHDMALDSECPELEGAEYDDVYGICLACSGEGTLAAAIANKLNQP
jgi:DnaJ-class molecular chaperone